jgi:hypothetical protein
MKFKQLLCFANFLHDYRLTRVHANSSFRFQCVVCGKETLYDSEAQNCIEWDKSNPDAVTLNVIIPNR